MNYKLMHKHIHVADILIDEAACAIVKTGTVYHLEHLPVGSLDGKGHIDRAALNEWWVGALFRQADREYRRPLSDACGHTAKPFR